MPYLSGLRRRENVALQPVVIHCSTALCSAPVFTKVLSDAKRTRRLQAGLRDADVSSRTKGILAFDILARLLLYLSVALLFSLVTSKNPP